MRILWITNTIFPAPSRVLGLPVPVTGGWMYSLAEQLASNSNIMLAVATVHYGNDFKVLDLDKIRYYLLPCRASLGYQKSLESFWQKICLNFSPDVVHIHGTEYSHGLACMRTCDSMNYIVSIQGLVSIIAKYYYAGLTPFDILKNITFRDIVRFNTVFHAKAMFASRGVFEKECIKRTKNVIGRTKWDKSHTMLLNPTVRYFFCNESLREGFYSAVKWDSDTKINHTIFLSQGSYPIKAVHQVLKAVALLKSEFPDTKVRIAGYNITDMSTLINRVRINGYGSYINRLIKQLKLEERVKFIGPLSEKKIIYEYLNAHLFICPSSIENSPNSVGEAQLLGVPTIASFVGGVPDMISHGETGLLYRFEDVEMLAEHIREIFNDNKLALHLSAHGIVAAEQRHNPISNYNKLIDIYNCVVT